MNDLNPYQSPSAFPSALEVSYSAESCPNCDSVVSFGAALKQGTPFRFKCPHCRARYRVQTPHMPLIFSVICCVIALSVVGVIVGVEQLGVVVLAPGGAGLALGWIVLEIWSFRYIKRHGRLVPLSRGGRSDAGGEQ